MYKAVCGFLWLVLLQQAAAERPHSFLFECEQALAQQGFENLSLAAAGDDTLYVDYENRVFRNEVTAAGVALAALNEKLVDVKVVALTPRNRDLAICTIYVPLSAYREFISGGLEARALADALVIDKGHGALSTAQWTSRAESSFGRVDVTVRPGVAFQLGNYDDRLKINVNLLPELSTTLWRGGRLLVQALAPLHDEIGLYTDEVRLSRAVLNQWLRLPGDGFASFSTGGFHPDRYGAAAECGYYFFDRHVHLGAAAEYSGFLLYQDKKWNYSPLGRWTYRAQGKYIFSQIDLIVGVQYAEYLHEDHGWQIEATRIWGDAEIGVYGAKTNIDRFGGVRLKIPLPPKRSSRPARLRVVSPGTLQLGYQATNEVYTIGGPVETGVTISTGQDLADLPKRLLPGYIRNNLGLWKKAAGYLR